MRIAGFDIGITADNPVGCAVIEYNAPGSIVSGLPFKLISLNVIRPEMKLDYQQRIAALATSSLHCVKDHRPALIGFERAAGHTNMQSGLKLAEMGGCIRAIGAFLNAPVYGIEPAQAKKGLTTYGAASKADVMECVKELFGARVLDRLGVFAPHGADAIAVALTALAVHTGALLPPKKKTTRRKKAA